MATTLRYGPGDHGRPMTFDEFREGDYEEGYKYELIQGRLYASPQARFSHDWIRNHVLLRLVAFKEARPDVIDYVTPGARVFVSDADPDEVTAPEPDLAAYRGFPLGREWEVDWRDVNPILVVEVLGGEDDQKDLVRNVDLYFRVPTLQEYWAFDIRANPGEPRMIVYRRAADRWAVSEYAADAIYTTDLLPGFELPVRPRQ
jgi:Uma2 family endonuclease